MPKPTEEFRSASVFNVRDVLRELARPRLSGTPGAQEVAAIVRARFETLGYQIRDYPFAFSSIPGRFAVTAAGVVFLFGTLGAARLLYRGYAGVALSVLLLVAFLTAAIAVLSPSLTTMLPFRRVAGANMLASRPGVRPRYLLAAHLDSKSQPVPLAFRGPIILIAIIAWSAFVVLAVLALLDPVWLMPRTTTLLAVVCFLAAVLLIFCWADNRSPGALDNASGLATLLGVAQAIDGMNDVGFLITDAEELGLVGARDIARKLDPVIGIINVDGIDDSGGFVILEKFGIPPRHIAPHLAAALLAASAELDVPAHRRNVPFGLLLDHIPLAQRHLPAVTLMRGTLASLRRVHRPTDSMDALTGAGVESAVTLLQRALIILHSQPSGPSL